MIIVGITDAHGYPSAAAGLARALASADLVLLAGDITHFGGGDDAAEVIDALAQCNPNILAISGNCDRPEVGELLAERGIALHGRGIVRAGVGFVGVGGSLACPSPTPNETTEAGLAGALDEGLAELPDGAPLVMVVHHPPCDTAVDNSTTKGHVGSRSVRSFIETHRPLVCISGHIHEAVGTDAIGPTRLINPGPMREGRYAYIELAPDHTLAACELRTA